MLAAARACVQASLSPGCVSVPPKAVTLPPPPALAALLAAKMLLNGVSCGTEVGAGASPPPPPVEVVVVLAGVRVVRAGMALPVI